MSRSRAVAVVASALLAAVVAPLSPAAAAAPPKVTTLVAEKQLAQQALLIGLASNVLQSQFQLDFYLRPGEVGRCEPLDGGGSDRVQSAVTSGRVTKGVNVLYYDASCTKKYMVQSAVYTAGTGSAPVNTLTATTTYYGLTGKKLGVMTTKETAQARGETGELLDGLGSFRPTGTTVAVSLGVGCALTFGEASMSAACQGGIAQDFPASRYSLGSVTPVSLTTKGRALSFSARTATRRAGAVHALSISKGRPQQLTLTGKGTNAGTDTVAGRAGSFSLFPPAPTGWTVTDAARHLTLTLNVTAGAVRNLTGTIKNTATKRTLATIALDQSGTGHLHYAGAATTPITSWVLTK